MTAELDKIDALCATEIVCDGSKYRWLPEGICFQSSSTDDWIIKYSRSEWQPTRNIAQAWDVLEKLGHEFSIDYEVSERQLTKYEVCIFYPGTCEGVKAHAGTASEAICLAALAAKGVKIE